MFSITTDSVLPQERAEFWTDHVSRHVNPMRIEPVRGVELRAVVLGRSLGDLTLTHMTGAGFRALHTRGEVARTPFPLHAACVHIDGEAAIERGGKRVELQPGSVFFTDSRDEFVLDLSQSWRHLVVTLPTAVLDSRVSRRDLVSGAVPQGPIARLWAGQLIAGFSMAAEFSRTAADMFARHSVELLVHALDETHCDRPLPAEDRREAVYLQACHPISFQFGDPGLTSERIARAVCVSTRTLERIFARHDDSVVRRIFDERIRHAAERLCAPQWAHRSITEIAFACGFNDSSHFTRVFASRIGTTPSQWRNQSDTSVPRATSRARPLD
jgi:AraC-like DNA-binding protein